MLIAPVLFKAAEGVTDDVLQMLSLLARCVHTLAADNSAEFGQQCQMESLLVLDVETRNPALELSKEQGILHNLFATLPDE